MKKVQISLIFSLILSLSMMSLVLAANYPIPFVGSQTDAPSNDLKAMCEKNGGTWYAPIEYCAHCPNGYSLTIRTEGGSRIYDCKKRESANIPNYLTGINENSSTSTSGTITPLAPQPPEKTQEQRDCEKKGFCYEKGKCYLQGYIKDGTYCKEKAFFPAPGIYRPGFVNQSETGSLCNQSYECKTGICSNNVCINLTKQQNQINLLEDNLTKLSQENAEIKSNLENLNNSLSETKDIAKKNSGLIQKITIFLKKWFGSSR